MVGSIVSWLSELVVPTTRPVPATTPPAGIIAPPLPCVPLLPGTEAPPRPWPPLPPCLLLFPLVWVSLLVGFLLPGLVLMSLVFVPRSVCTERPDVSCDELPP